MPEGRAGREAAVLRVILRADFINRFVDFGFNQNPKNPKCICSILLHLLHFRNSNWTLVRQIDCDICDKYCLSCKRYSASDFNRKSNIDFQTRMDRGY